MRGFPSRFRELFRGIVFLLDGLQKPLNNGAFHQNKPPIGDVICIYGRRRFITTPRTVFRLFMLSYKKHAL
jgi:hypothetical protein